MDKKVNELVEQMARTLQDRDADMGECSASWYESTKCTNDYYRESIRKCLSHPDLALIDSEQSLSESVKLKLGFSSDINKGQLSLTNNGWKKVIRLAEAFKKANHG